MSMRLSGLAKLVLALLALVAAPLAPCQAQFASGGGFADMYSQNGLSGMAATRVAPPGGWAEVLTTTPKWLVIQNQQGQQFPVAFADVQMFVIRWPTTLDQVAAGSLVEATGVDMGTNQVLTDHVDVYEGTAGQLGVFPTIQTIIGYNRIMTAFDVEQHNTYGIDYFRYLSPGEFGIPPRLHVVGPIVNVNPVLSLGVGGGIAVSIIPSAGSLFITSITPGSASFVRKGDLVYFAPVEANPKSLVLSQLVVYKKIPQSQFTP
jgi:hypothetical protein